MFIVKKYKVLRSHYGDKDYKEGDTRTADPNNVRHLVNSKILVEIADKIEEKPKVTTSRSTKVKSE